MAFEYAVKISCCRVRLSWFVSKRMPSAFSLALSQLVRNCRLLKIGTERLRPIAWLKFTLKSCCPKGIFPTVAWKPGLTTYRVIPGETSTEPSVSFLPVGVNTTFSWSGNWLEYLDPILAKAESVGYIEAFAACIFFKAAS